MGGVERTGGGSRAGETLGVQDREERCLVFLELQCYPDSSHHSRTSFGGALVQGVGPVLGLATKKENDQGCWL